VPADRVEVVSAAVRAAVHAAGYDEPAITPTYAADGASAT
jgi:galactokinase